MSYSLNCLKVVYKGLYTGLLHGVIKGMLGVETMVHMLQPQKVLGGQRDLVSILISASSIRHIMTCISPPSYS